MNYFEETQGADEASSRKEKPRRRLFVRVALAALLCYRAFRSDFAGSSSWSCWC